MKTFLLRFFTWWNGQTFGTQLWTWLYGELVGEDEFGNHYFRTKRGKIDPTLGFERRWVIYNGIAEPFDRATVMAWLAASHRRCPANGGERHPAAVVEAPPAQPHRHTGRAPSHRFDPCPGPQTESHRRLQSLDAGQLRF